MHLEPKQTFKKHTESIAVAVPTNSDFLGILKLSLTHKMQMNFKENRIIEERINREVVFPLSFNQGQYLIGSAVFSY